MVSFGISGYNFLSNEFKLNFYVLNKHIKFQVDSLIFTQVIAVGNFFNKQADSIEEHFFRDQVSKHENLIKMANRKIRANPIPPHMMRMGKNV